MGPESTDQEVIEYFKKCKSNSDLFVSNGDFVLAAIRSNFPREYYLFRNFDVFLSGFDPWIHYVRFGFAEQRCLLPCGMSTDTLFHENNVSPESRIEEYLKANDPVEFNLYKSFTNARIKSSGALVQAIGLDIPWYRAAYMSIDDTDDAILAHFMTQRYKDKLLRPHGEWSVIKKRNAFNGNSYLYLNPDVAAAGVDPWHHYVAYGGSEGRSIVPLELDIPWYTSVYMAEKVGENEAVDHYIKSLATGAPVLPSGPDILADIRSRFKPEEYLQQNPDVAVAGIEPWFHYVAYGYSEGRMVAADYHPLLGDVSDLRHKINWSLRSVQGMDPDLDVLVLREIRAEAIRTAPYRRNEQDVLNRCFEAIDKPYKYIVVGEGCADGGLQKYAGAICAQLEKKAPGEVLYLDMGDYSAFDWTHGLDEQHVLALSKISCDKTIEESVQRRILSWIISAMKPASLICVDSRAMWRELETNGDALQHFTSLYAVLVSNDGSVGCDEKETISRVRNVLPVVRGILVEDTSVRCRLMEDLAPLGKLSDKLHVAPALASQAPEGGSESDFLTALVEAGL